MGKKVILHILERFPYYAKEIKQLLRDHPGFNDLCRDYGKCVEAFSYWSQANTPQSQERITEYQGLICSLETEIIKYLEQQN